VALAGEEVVDGLLAYELDKFEQARRQLRGDVPADTFFVSRLAVPRQVAILDGRWKADGGRL
jgi:hypothetical protein